MESLKTPKEAQADAQKWLSNSVPNALPNFRFDVPIRVAEFSASFLSEFTAELLADFFGTSKFSKCCHPKNLRIFLRFADYARRNAKQVLKNQQVSGCITLVDLFGFEMRKTCGSFGLGCRTLADFSVPCLRNLSEFL